MTTRNNTRTVGEATIELLEAYGIDTVFGIPGVHTLDYYRGLSHSKMHHVLVRHEQGAGYMADGYARMTGKPALCCLITGPGVTNAITPMGQSYADSLPMLVLSSSMSSDAMGKGWGRLHEISDQEAVTAPVTAFSATAMRPSDVPELIGRAFSVFASARPRPVHISIPIDVLAMTVSEEWTVRTAPGLPAANPTTIREAAELLSTAKQPVIMVGGGAINAGEQLTAIAEHLDAAVIPSNAAKGIVPDSHQLNLGATVWRAPTLDHLSSADVILAVGTELGSDSYMPHLPMDGAIIRIDIDPAKINDHYPAAVGIVSDVASALPLLMDQLADIGKAIVRPNLHDQLAEIKQAASAPSNSVEQQHIKVLNSVRAATGDEGVLIGDMTQVIYSGSFAWQAEKPRQWHYAGAWCTLGCAMPMAIGAKLARPDLPIVSVSGDGGFMFTMQELMVAVEQKLSLPIIIWHNSAYKQIKDDMESMEYAAIGVDPTPPDFMLLAKSFGCLGHQPTSLADFEAAIQTALTADGPTIIEVRQDSDYLM